MRDQGRKKSETAAARKKAPCRPQGFIHVAIYRRYCSTKQESTDYIAFPGPKLISTQHTIDGMISL